MTSELEKWDDIIDGEEKVSVAGSSVVIGTALTSGSIGDTITVAINI